MPKLMVAALVALALTLMPQVAGTVHAADPFLRLNADATYRVDTDDRLVRVRIDFDATNRRPNVVRRTSLGTVTTRYYFDRVVFAVPSEARSVRSTSGGRRLTTSVRARTGYREVTVRFPNLFYRASRSIRVEFSMPAGKPRSSSGVRVGSAFTTFTAWVWGDPGRSSVRIVLPSGFDEDGYGDDLSQRTHPDRVELTADAIARPDEWYRVVVAERPAALTQLRIDAGGRPVVVQAWPEDTVWRDQVAEVLEEGLPALEDRIGLPWPVSGDLQVSEVHAALLHGYAGFYDANTDAITMSEELDDHTILHEASHAWFNGSLILDRWIDEGLADYYADLVREELGLSDEFRPTETELTAEGAFPLNDWPDPSRIDDPQVEARERFGYDASYTVIARIARDIGEDGMRAVLAAADGEENPYRGDGGAERTGLTLDWRWFLDLVEEIGESDEAGDLFRSWVVPTSGHALLRTRDEARAAYDALDQAAGEWAVPRGIRANMSLWRFDDATKLIDDAEALVEQRDDLATAAGELGLRTPADLETAFETSVRADDFKKVATTIEARLDAADAVADARDALATERSPIAALGLVGETPDSAYGAARAAFETGDVAGAVAGSDATLTMLAGAESAGTTRALLVGLVLVVVLLVLVGLAVARRRRRRRLALGTAASDASSTLAATPDPVDARPVVPSTPIETAPGAEPD